MPLKTQKQLEADHRATATAMIVSDMRAAGFSARANANGNALVSLTRPLMPHEVEAALESAGYDPGQCQLHRTAGGVEVVAITG